MFSTLIDWLLTPVNFVRKTFGWLPEDGTDENPEEVTLKEAAVANGGPSASNFAALRQSAYDTEDGASSVIDANNFAGLSLVAPDIISAEDWQTLSMAEIDAKLIANGEAPLGDQLGDPFYDLNPLEIADLADDAFQALLDQVTWGEPLPAWEGVISDEDWATLSLAEIDDTLMSNGLDPIGDSTGDPFYHLTPSEIDALADEEYAAMAGAYGWDDLYFPAWEGVVSPSDLAVLSPAELDAKLLAAAFETVGTEESPFYHLTGEDIQLLPDTALVQLYQDEQAVYQSLGYAVAGGGVPDTQGTPTTTVDTGTDTGTGTGTASEEQDQLDWLVG